MTGSGQGKSSSNRPAGWATAPATVVHVEEPRFARRRGRDLRTGERLTRYFVLLRVRPKNVDAFDVEGVLLADMEISVGSKLRVHYDPRRPTRWTLAPRAMYNSVPRRAAEVARSTATPPTTTSVAAAARTEVPAAGQPQPAGGPISIDLTHPDAVWADHDGSHLQPSVVMSSDGCVAPVAIAPVPDPALVSGDGGAAATTTTTAGVEPAMLPIGELPADLAEALSDSMTARFQALTLGGGFPSPADIAAMAETLAAQADRRQAISRHRPSSHRPIATPERDLATQLTDLSRLHLAGSLSDREFAMAKAQLLGS